jgi:acetolactate synthase-1/2/3 large subunit
MKLSDYVLDVLAQAGVTHVFEVCGGSLAHLLDSFYGRKDISTVSMHHEMAASIAAEGYARASGRLGVAMATSGPGATNMITGIGSCFFDSIPCLFITGQVNTYEFKFDRPVRQKGFQETDIVSIVKPIAKDAFLVEEADKIKQLLCQAIQIAGSDRPGPVLLDIPLNIQRADIEPGTLRYCTINPLPPKSPDEKALNEVLEMIRSSSRPVILAGGGVRISNSQDLLLKFAQMTGIPLVTSLMGLDSFPHDDPLFAGMIGTYGNRYANLTVANSDLILALGTRLDTRQTGTKPETFARGAKIVHVDIDPHELNSNIKAHCPFNLDIGSFLLGMMKLMKSGILADGGRLMPWKKMIMSYKTRYPSFRMPKSDAIDPNYFMHILSEFLPDDALVCVDVGQIQMWSAQTLDIHGTQRFLTQGGMASMGSALPMAIGASFAKPDKVIVVITGDGGFQLNIQELQTVYHHNLPVKIILINNRCYGMVRQFQEQYFDGRYQSTVIGYSNPDFRDVVSAYKIPAARITRNDEISDTLAKLFDDRNPAFLEASINTDCKVMPKLSVNMPLEDQEPHLHRDELRSNMFIDLLPVPGGL